MEQLGKTQREFAKTLCQSAADSRKGLTRLHNRKRRTLYTLGGALDADSMGVMGAKALTV
jgi:hypothetical protein